MVGQSPGNCKFKSLMDVLVIYLIYVYHGPASYIIWLYFNSINHLIAGKQIYGFPDRNLMLDDDSLDQTVASLTARGSPQGERIERFSRKVFVGGLPPDIDEGKIKPSKL